MPSAAGRTEPFDIMQPLHTAQEALQYDSEHKLRQENLPFDIDVWYPKLQVHTFRTSFLPLSLAEAKAVVRYYRARFIEEQAAVSAPDVAVLHELEHRLDSHIKQCYGSTGCFLRLCGRSAKDAEPLSRPAVREEYMQRLHEAEREPGLDAASAEGKMWAVSRTGGVLRCASGADCMSLLLSSERVYSDLLDVIWFGEPEQLVLREWEPELTLDHEFRAFVCDGQITAITQYDHFCRYDHLFALRPKLQGMITARWQALHPLVGVESYAADFGYLPSADAVVLIELSPFARCTGGGCFRWSNVADAAVLHGGAAPASQAAAEEVAEGAAEEQEEKNRQPEFRLVEKSAQGLEQLLNTNWEARWGVSLPAGLTATAEATVDTSRDPPPFWSLYETACRRRLRLFVDSWRRAAASGSSPWALAAIGVCSAAAAVARGTTEDLPFWAVPLCALVAWLLAGFVHQCWQRCRPRRRQHALFVYGTLRRGFHWNSKYMSSAECCAPATTVGRCPLVVGGCGVPYMLGVGVPGNDNDGGGAASAAHRVRGELWLVDDETLAALDDYEGVGLKGYYDRVPVEVEVSAAAAGRWWLGRCARPSHTTAWVYVLREPELELVQLPRIAEYTLELHDDVYKPVAHIKVKQQLYLAASCRYSETTPHAEVQLKGACS
eukprot:SAG22_NODE_483_length_9925_cov_3.568186_1_plen_664_part_00